MNKYIKDIIIASAGLLATGVAMGVDLPSKTIYVGSTKNLSAITSTTAPVETFTWDDTSNTLSQITFGGSYDLTIDKNLYLSSYINFKDGGSNTITVNDGVTLKIAGLSMADTARNVTFVGDGNLEFDGALNFYYYGGDATKRSDYVFNMTNGLGFNGKITVKHNQYVTLGKIYNTSASNLEMSGDSVLSFETMNTTDKKGTIGNITLKNTAILQDSIISNTNSSTITLTEGASITYSQISGAISNIKMGTSDVESTGMITNVNFGSTVGNITMYGGAITDSSIAGNITSLTMYDASVSNTTFAKNIGTINLYGTSSLSYKDAYVASKWNPIKINASGTSKLVVDNDGNAYYRASFNLSENASVAITSIRTEAKDVSIFNSSKNSSFSGNLIFYDTTISGAGKLIVGGDITITENRTLTMNTSNVLVTDASSNKNDVPLYASNGAKLVLNAAQDFSKINLNANSNFIIDLKGDLSSNSNKLSFETLVFNANTKLVIYDFVDNIIVSTNDFSDKLTNIEVYSDNGSTLIDADTLRVCLIEGTDLYGLISIIPEPAEWAAIFGAFALGFALYRRRK